VATEPKPAEKTGRKPRARSKTSGVKNQAQMFGGDADAGPAKPKQVKSRSRRTKSEAVAEAEPKFNSKILTQASLSTYFSEVNPERIKGIPEILSTIEGKGNASKCTNEYCQVILCAHIFLCCLLPLMI
jgi:hypothetical protein